MKKGYKKQSNWIIIFQMKKQETNSLFDYFAAFHLIMQIDNCLLKIHNRSFCMQVFC